MVLKPMVTDAYEPTFAMGDDSPLPPMATRPRPIAHFLRQRFAQVTNPPIDPLRERLVMSLRTLLGPRGPLLGEHADASRLLVLESFFVYPSAVESLLRRDVNPFATVRLDTTFAVDDRRPGDGGRGSPAGRRRRPSGRRGCGHRGARGPDQRTRASAHPFAAGPRRRPPTAHVDPAALRRQPRGRGRRRPRHPRHRRTRRVRRRPGVSPPGAADRRRRGRRLRRRRHGQLRRPGALPRRRRSRRAQDPVEDGHLDDRLATAPPRSSRSSASTPSVVDLCFTGTADPSAAWAGTSSARTRSTPPRGPRRRRARPRLAGLLPGPQGRRVPRQRQGGHRRAQRA